MAESTAPGHAGFRQLLAFRPACLYIVGQLFSAFGDNAMWIAAGVWVKELTHSTPAAGLLVFTYVAPQLPAAPVAGFIADQVSRKHFLMAANLTSAAIVFAMLLVRGPHQVWLIYLCMGLYGLSTAAISTTQSALLTDVVPRDVLTVASGTINGGRETLRIAAPVIGALLLTAVGPWAPILLDDITFVIATICLLPLPSKRPKPVAGEDRFIGEFLAGLRFGKNDALLRRVILAGCVIFTAYGLSETVIYALTDVLHRSASFVGLLSSTTGIGAVVGGPAAVVIARRKGNAVAALAGMTLLASACALQAIGTMPSVLIGEAVFGASLPLVIVGLYTLIQLGSPSHLQGRVYGAFEVIAGLPQVLAVAVGAGLVALIGVRYLLATMAVLAVTACAVTLGLPARERQGLEPASAQPVVDHKGIVELETRFPDAVRNTPDNRSPGRRQDDE